MWLRSQSTKLMDLPIEMKAEVFLYLDRKSRLRIRLTCSKFKILIDTFVGLTVALDETDWPQIIESDDGTFIEIKNSKQYLKTEFFKQICIRRAWVQQLTLKNLFRFPAYLKSLLIGRGSTKDALVSILNECKNLIDFQMQTVVSGRMHSEDFPSDSKYSLLPKLRTLSFFMEPTSSLSQWDIGAFNVLQLIRRIRSPKLSRFYLDTWISPSVSIYETVEALIPFLFYHESLRTVIIGINHINQEEPSFDDFLQMGKLAKDFIEPIFQGLFFQQKSLTFSNLKLVEFQALYPYLKAQTKIEKLTVTNWLGRTQSWIMYIPIFNRNANSLQKVHLSIETNVPFDFQIVSALQGLTEFALFVNGSLLNTNFVNGLNTNLLPQKLELLILSNLLIPTEDLKSIPERLSKLKVFALVQVRGMPSSNEGLRLKTVKRFLIMPKLDDLLLCGVWLPNLAERNSMQTVSLLLTGKKEYYLNTDLNKDDYAHKYWTLTRVENTQNANLSFHLLLPY